MPTMPTIPTMPGATSTEKTTTERDHLAALSRQNLQGFTAAKRKEAANERGRSTPSASPDFHEYQSDASWLPENHPDAPRCQMDPELRRRLNDPEERAKLFEELGFPPEDDPDGPFYRSPQCETRVESLQHEEIPKEESPEDKRARLGLEQMRAAENGELPPGTKAVCSANQSLLDILIDSAQKTEEEKQASWEALMAREYAKTQGPRLPNARPEIPRQQPSALDVPETKQPEEHDPPTKPNPQFPPNFPAYHCTQNMNEIAAFLANASYVASLGGPPLADLKYGILVFPVGEEGLLFGPQPEFSFTQDFIDAVEDANRDFEKALRMHNPDFDSGDFVRHRFEDNFRSVASGEVMNVDNRPDAEDHGESQTGKEPEDQDDAPDADVGDDHIDIIDQAAQKHNNIARPLSWPSQARCVRLKGHQCAWKTKDLCCSQRKACQEWIRQGQFIQASGGRQREAEAAGYGDCRGCCVVTPSDKENVRAQEAHLKASEHELKRGVDIC